MVADTPMKPRFPVADALPAVWFVASLFVKQIAFGLLLADVWWAEPEPLDQWLAGHLPFIASSLGFPCLIVVATMGLPSAARAAVLVVLDVVLSAVIVADVAHLRFYGDTLSLLAISQVHMLGDIRSSVLDVLEPGDAWYFADALAAAFLLVPYLRLARAVPTAEPHARLRVARGLAVAGLLLLLPSAGALLRDSNGRLAFTSLQRDVCAALGPFPYHLLDAYLHRSGRHFEVSGEDLARVRALVAATREARAKPSPLFGAARGSNVILLSAESLMAFPLGLEVEGQAVTPVLDALAGESLRFTNFYDQTHLGTTSDAEFLALQSLHPVGVGVIAGQYLRNRWYALPEILSRHGYDTLSASGEPPGFWHMDELHPAYGMRTSFFAPHFEITRRIGPWMADDQFFEQTLPILAGRKQPFMAFLLSSSNHSPFDEIPQELRTLRLGELEGTQLGDYLQSVHYFDMALGRFVDGLRKSGMLDRTVFVMYGDHHAYLGEDDDVARLLGLPAGDPVARFRSRERVAFLIRLPHGAAAGERSTEAGEIDIAPTLLSLLGVRADDAVMLGRDLTRDEPGLVVFRDGSFSDGEHLFMNRFGPLSASSCHELASGRKIDCERLTEKRREAHERLAVSDLIVRGDLIPALRARANAGPVVTASPINATP